MNVSKPGPHIDQMLRQTRIHHVQLSSMADVKANMMLTLASLIITFCIRYLTDPILRYPVITLIIFCLITIFSAAYAVMPIAPKEAKPDPKDPQCDILFFGNFMNLSYVEYKEAMEIVMSEPAHTYEAQVREVYDLGVFLGMKKYRFIRYAYSAFILGLFVSGVVFFVVELAVA